MDVVQCGHKGGPTAEVGIEFKCPDDENFQQPGSAHPDVQTFSARSDPNGGGETFLGLTRPQTGMWQFRVWQKDFPAGADASGGRVELEVIEQALETLEDEIRGADGPLRGPGNLSARVVRVWIRRREKPCSR